MDVKRPLGMLVPMLSALVVQAVPLKIDNPSFEETKDGRCTGWELSQGMRQGRSAGHNGSSGLVWESAGPNEKQDFASHVVPLEAGKAYNFSVLVRTEGFKSRKYGATMCIEWRDGNGKWMAGAYAHGVTNPDEDWTLVKGQTREIPAEAASVTAMIFITPGCSGKAYFDNVTIEPVDREPVAFVFSSAYRNVAAEGPIRFHASLYRPAGQKDTRAVFVRRDAAGAERRNEPTEESADGATLAIDIADLPMGRSEVVCELLSKDGRLLGRAVCPFERVKTLPERRVWIDAHKRCIVDGQPFFPLGMYTGKIDDEMLERYCEGPFNVVMPYAPTTCRELDLLQARGIRGFISLRSQLLGTEWAKRNNITRQEQVDAFYETEINKSKRHPALLGWYVCDERPATEIPDRTHLHGVFARTDPDHPTWAVLDRTYDLREFIPTFDVLGMDPYPIGRKPLKHVTDLVRETKRAVFDDVALWNVPQTFDWGWFRKDHGEKGLRFPTEAEIANMNWQHIALGANGLIAYNFHSLKRDCDPKDAPEFWGRICRAFEPVRKMIPVMLSVDPAPGIDNVPEMMPVRTWMKDGELYVLAVNPLAEPQSAKLFVGGGDWALAGVEVGAAEKAEVAGNRIDLTLAPTGFAMLRLRRVTRASCEMWRRLDPPRKYLDFERKVVRISRQETPDYDIECYEQANGPGTRQRVMMVIPKGASGSERLPAVVVPYYFVEGTIGREFDGTPLPHYMGVAFAADLVKRGFVCITADAYHLTYLRSSRPRSDFGRWDEAASAFNRDWPEWSGIGKLAFDTRLLVDVLASDPRVDSGRIGIMGHSLGGKMAFYAGCTDPRIRVIVASDWGAGWDSTNWSAPWYWGERKLAELKSAGITHADLYGIAGSKPFLLIAGHDDTEASRRMFAREECRDFAFLNHATGHRPPHDAVEAGYGFLVSRLRSSE